MKRGEKIIGALLIVGVVVFSIFFALKTTSPINNTGEEKINFDTRAAYTYWARTYGGSDAESAEAIQQTSDGGYIVAGRTRSFGAGNYDTWVLKLNSDGSIAWQKTYGGRDGDEA